MKFILNHLKLILCILIIFFIIASIILIKTMEKTPNHQPTYTKPPTGSYMKKPSHIILALGDSLTAGYEISKTNSYPYLLQKQLNQKFKNFHTKIINVGISGSTTSSALLRLQKHLKTKNNINILILALGANDGLRGIPISTIQKNLQQTIDLAINHQIKVILAGMKLPLSHGNQYRSSFEALFKNLAKKNKITFIPFLLKGVANQPHLNLLDGIHPNEQGHQVISQTLLPFLEEFYQ